MLREKSIWGRAGVCLLGFGLCRHLEKNSGEKKGERKAHNSQQPPALQRMSLAPLVV